MDARPWAQSAVARIKSSSSTWHLKRCGGGWQRLHREKVDAGLGNYFRVSNLTASGELALLWTADKVAGRDAHSDLRLPGYGATIVSWNDGPV